MVHAPSCTRDINDQRRMLHTFFAGFPSALPLAFFTAPLALSLAVGVPFFLDAAAGFATRPPAVAFARGLEVLALGLEAAPEPKAGFFDVVLVLALVVLVVVLAGAGT